MDRAQILEDLKEWLMDEIAFPVGLTMGDVLIKIDELEEIYE